MAGLVALTALLLASACEAPPDGDGSAAVERVRVDEGMAGTPDPGFARALAPREFVFPADHGPHPAYATEWWYFTGNLTDAGGRRFGYQLTLFRVGLEPGEPAGDSDWRAHQIYMGHLAVSDAAGRRHYRAERFSRAAAGLAGADTSPLRVWLGPWHIAGSEGPATPFPLRLSADDADFAIELAVERGVKAIVLQGDRGLSQKGAAPGNASYYYSMTRLPTQGRLRLGDDWFDVTGNSWFDREWSSSALAEDQAGWDWFALHLDDGRDLMFYRMRGKDGAAQRFSKGVLVDRDGGKQALTLADVELAEQRWWTADDGTRYPVAWRLSLPAHGIALDVVAAFDAQEMDVTVRYWEGAVDISGTHGGVGYLEMSGYAD
jgi:predicted secreted hydrolase